MLYGILFLFSCGLFGIVVRQLSGLSEEPQGIVLVWVAGFLEVNIFKNVNFSERSGYFVCVCVCVCFSNQSSAHVLIAVAL